MKNFFKNIASIFGGSLAGALIASPLMFIFYYYSGTYSNILDGVVQNLGTHHSLLGMGVLFFTIGGVSLFSISGLTAVIFCIFYFFNRDKNINTTLLFYFAVVGGLMTASVLVANEVFLGAIFLEFVWVIFLIWAILTNFVIFKTSLKVPNNQKLILWLSSILCVIFIGSFVYITFGSVDSDQPNPPAINSLEEYDAYLGSTCKDAGFSSGESFATCAWTVLMNDEMGEGKMRMYAQQQRLAIEQQNALRKSDSELKSELVAGLSSLIESYDNELGIKMTAYRLEFGWRHKGEKEDPEVSSLMDSMLSKYGPCWGIPEGQCKE